MSSDPHALTHFPAEFLNEGFCRASWDRECATFEVGTRSSEIFDAPAFRVLLEAGVLSIERT